MSSSTLGKVIQRAISDAAFRRQLQTNPEGALRGFDLTADESAALRSGDATRLTALGIDQRVSKAFNMGANFGANSSSDLSANSSADLGANSAADLSGNSAANMSANDAIPLVDAGAGSGDALIPGSVSASEASISGGDGVAGSAYITADEEGHDTLGVVHGDGSALAPQVEGTQVDTHMSSGDFDSGAAAPQVDDTETLGGGGHGVADS